MCLTFNGFPNNKFFDFSKLNDFADGNLKLDENGKKSSLKGSKTLWKKEKMHIMRNFSFSNSVFRRLGLQTCKNKGLFGKGLSYLLILYHIIRIFYDLQGEAF